MEQRIKNIEEFNKLKCKDKECFIFRINKKNYEIEFVGIKNKNIRFSQKKISDILPAYRILMVFDDNSKNPFSNFDDYSWMFVYCYQRHAITCIKSIINCDYKYAVNFRLFDDIDFYGLIEVLNKKLEDVSDKFIYKISKLRAENENLKNYIYENLNK